MSERMSEWVSKRVFQGYIFVHFLCEVVTGFTQYCRWITLSWIILKQAVSEVDGREGGREWVGEFVSE